MKNKLDKLNRDIIDIDFDYFLNIFTFMELNGDISTEALNDFIYKIERIKDNINKIEKAGNIEYI